MRINTSTRTVLLIFFTSSVLEKNAVLRVDMLLLFLPFFVVDILEGGLSVVLTNFLG